MEYEGLSFYLRVLTTCYTNYIVFVCWIIQCQCHNAIADPKLNIITGESQTVYEVATLSELAFHYVNDQVYCYDYVNDWALRTHCGVPDDWALWTTS